MPDRFDEFWELAVRKVGKGAARKAHGRAIKRADEGRIWNAWVRANKVWRGKDIQFVPHPATWFNQDRWDDDEFVMATRDAVGSPHYLEIIAAHVRRPWCQCGRYPRDVLEQCVAADLLTRDEMEAAL